MKRTYIKKGVWHLGGRKKQKVGFLPILLALSKSILFSAAGSIGSKLLQGVGKNILGVEKVDIDEDVED